ncbi:MAG: hypothetical protein AAGC53_05445 [Actinomycetota bacterium]
MSVRVPTTERSRRTRAELARSTRDVLAAEGVIRADAIAQAAKVSTATFYAHFESHDDALGAALDLALDSIVGAATTSFRFEALIENGLDAVAHDLVERMHVAFRAESQVMRAALARMGYHRPIRDIYRAHERRSFEHVVRQIDLGQKAGVLRSGPIEAIATALLVVVQGIHNPLLAKQQIDPAVAASLCVAISALLAPDGGAATTQRP